MMMSSPSEAQPRGRRSKGVAPKNLSQAARFSSKKDPGTSEIQKNSANFLAIASGFFALFLLAFALYATAFSLLFHNVSQASLRTSFSDELKNATAPTSEVDYQNNILTQGAPVAVLKIPQIGVNEVVSEGTDSYTMRSGPGHRRDTVLPGQAGTSIIMGRATAYGGPFDRLQQLRPGQTFEVITGQGVHKFKVLGMRYANDYSLPPVPAGESRLTLVSARGAPFLPEGLVRLDAQLVSAVHPAGLRISTIFEVPQEDREFGFDFRFGWALVLALQFLVLVEVGAFMAVRRFGGAPTYLVFAPLTLFALVLVLDQASRLLPNLL
jgi:LPXTG-site transpeptidase (sortase) family protein